MEFLIKNFDDSNFDQDEDRSGCRKRGMVDAMMPDDHTWGRLECLPKFVIIKVPGLTASEVDAYEGLRKVWRDDFAYEVTGQNVNQGWYDVRVWEQNASPSGANAIGATKRDKIEGYLTRWGCTNIAFADAALSFRISLWNAVRSVEFWDITALQLAEVSFGLVSYASGIGTIKVTVPQAWKPEQITQKVIGRGGAITSAAHPIYTFTIERGVLLNTFREAVKLKGEQVYMFQRYRINQSTMDAGEANGGLITMTKAQLLAAVVDSMNG
jgi:hypothetical protein